MYFTSVLKESPPCGELQAAFGRFAKLRESCKGWLAASKVPTSWGCAALP